MANRGIVFPVILSGGAGTRLWPLSRAEYPKQFLSLTSELSLLQETVLRVASSKLFNKPTVITNEEHRFVVAEQLRKINITPKDIVLEPAPRNTASAAAVASVILVKQDPDAVILLMPSDHYIQEPTVFETVVEMGVSAANEGKLVTYGIETTHPETGYGYIQKGLPLSNIAGCFEVAEFVEKPDYERAKIFIQQNKFNWNSGIFVFRAMDFLSELERLNPNIYDACFSAVTQSKGDLDLVRLHREAFLKSDALSIDKAVMENTDKAVVIPVQMGWNDVGGWNALWKLAIRDEAGNSKFGDVLIKDVSDSYLRSNGGHLLAVSGVRDLVIVTTEDATLVVPRDQAGERVKELVTELKNMDRLEATQHLRLYRPWGYSQQIDFGDRFKVKRLVVNPGASLSLQRHFKRAEHWVVVKGVATVVRGKDTLRLTPDQSTYIPLGQVHRLENAEDEPLHVVEVQTGDYLDEDDIERFEDNYGRTI